MTDPDKPIEHILRELRERTKELDCLYEVEGILRDSTSPLRTIFCALLRTIPLGWQYSECCRARITYRGESYQIPEFVPTSWLQSAPILVQGSAVGQLEVCYIEATPKADEGPFLKEERRLINTLGERIGFFLAHRGLRQALTKVETVRAAQKDGDSGQWAIILDFLKRTDPGLLMRISRKMANHLAWSGTPEAIDLLQRSFPGPEPDSTDAKDENQPLEKRQAEDYLRIADATFHIAQQQLSDEEIISCIHTWIQDDKARFLVNAIEGRDTPLSEVRTAIERYSRMSRGGQELSPAVREGLLVSLVQRFFNDQMDFLRAAKRVLHIEDFTGLVESMIFFPKSHGKLGGKSAGLFLAMAVLREAAQREPLIAGIKVPKTWYITSDGVQDFIRHNNLEEVYNQKYIEIEQVRQEYPHLIQVFKNSRFSTEILDGLSVALDDLDGAPLIVRSSSLLEDRSGAIFSGKYKSLFLANLGSKQERLAALTDAIAEVYASLFGPDPIGYRAERGLLDVFEEMGIMIQQVVGAKVGPYFLPAFSGVAFSHNEFRWSPRIQRNDGLVRIVPGLGTRAVDRLKDDYPVLLTPGQPGLRVNVTPDEVYKYSPKRCDVINLETGVFETIEVADLLQRFGEEFPNIAQTVSLYDGDRVRRSGGLLPDFEREMPVITFEGLVQTTPFLRTMQGVLRILEDSLGHPVDIEFASDGKELHLLQCRPQSRGGEASPASIPRDTPQDRILFTANRYVSNGRVDGITHLVYVDPTRYNELLDLEEMRAVGRAVSRLNGILPKRQFILMGPGRWGSRGDIKLGVNVTYSDINNTAMLIEIARKTGNYLPDLSFGTHFFQDLVESRIRYLPLYPDDEGILFREDFLTGAPSILSEILPDAGSLGHALRVIDVPQVTGGLVLRVLMNGDLNMAQGVLMTPEATPGDIITVAEPDLPRPEQHWRWRQGFAERLAAEIDADALGVEAVYLLGSTKNATAGPASDIDLMVHFRGSEEQRLMLSHWLEGWSLCLSEVNFLRTGYQTQGLLDVHIITDEDIEKRTSYAVKIGAITDPARPLSLRRRVRNAG